MQGHEAVMCCDAELRADLCYSEVRVFQQLDAGRTYVADTSVVVLVFFGWTKRQSFTSV